MNARMLLALLLTVVCAPFSSAEVSDLRPELEVTGRVSEITVSPAGDLWITTAMGHAYRSDDGGRSWGEVAVPSRKRKMPESFFSDHLERITFFDERRAMITGYIGERSDVVFLSDDAGATWRKAKLPEGEWIYDAQTMSDGHAWLTGSDGSVLRSDDYGATWRKLTRPFDPDERTMSVWFETPERGVVATLFSGELATTNDGGLTWRRFEAKGREAVVRGCGEEHDKRITKVRVHGGRLLILQCGGVFESPLEAPRAWTRVTANGKPLLDFELRNGRVIGVTKEAQVIELSEDGSTRSLHELERVPMAMSVSGKRIALLDSRMKVTRFDGDVWASSRMLGKGVATSWPIIALDRGAEDVLWGTSGFFLYRSTDGAKTWNRIAELPNDAGRLLIQRDGNVLLANEHGWVGRWDVSAKQLVDVPVLSGLDISGDFRREDLWLVYGGRRFDTAGRVEVAQTFVSGEFAGSVDFGFVAASTDGGVTWTLVDRWKDEGPQAAFFSDDNRLTLVSWLGGVRQGTITREPLGAKMQTLVRGEDRKRAPYVQRATVLNLLDAKRGSLFGWIHHVGGVAWQTTDGGRSWKKSNEQHEIYALERLFDGTWIGLAPPSELRRWNGKSFERLVSAPGKLRRLWVDSRGELTVGLEDGTLHVLDAKTRTFRALAPATSSTGSAESDARAFFFANVVEQSRRTSAPVR